MRRFDYYAGVLILASALFLGQMAARHGSTTIAQAQGEAATTATQAQGGAATDTAQTQGETAKVPDVLKAHELQLVDAKGRLRATLQASDSGTTLRLSTPDGKTNTDLSQSSDGGMILLGADSSNSTAVVLGASNKGSSWMTLYGDHTSIQAATKDGDANSPHISFQKGDETTTLPSP